MTSNLSESERLNQLFEEHQKLVPHFVYKICGRFSITIEQQEDIISEGYTELWNLCLEYDESRDFSFKSYLCIRLRGLVIDNLRRNKRMFNKAAHLGDHVKHMMASVAGTRTAKPFIPLVSNQEDPENRLEARDLILKVIDCLSEKEKLVVRAHYFEQKRFVEIADESLGLTKSWVSRIHQSALKKLKRAAEDLGEEIKL